MASAGATAAVAFVAGLNFAYHAPSLHVALETTASIAASAAAFLLLGRFRRTGFLDELLLSAGLSVLALSNLAFAALPAAFDVKTNQGSVWAMLFTGTIAAALICLGALLPRRRIRVGGQWPVTVYGGTLALAIAGAVPMVVFPKLLPPAVKAAHHVGTTHPHPTANPTELTLQLFLAVLYLLAAYGFARRHRLTRDELSGWLMVACIFSAGAGVNYFFHPSLYSNWVYTGDVFRLGFYLALLVGAAREITSYWMSAISAASLEERRRIACDVHDGLAQEIAFIGRNVQLLRMQGADPDLVDRITEGVERAREESRRVVGALTSTADQPFEQVLEQAARDAARRYGATIDMQLARGTTLSRRKQEAVVRIATEAVTNAARHSGAAHLHLALERLNQGIRLRVADDGVGFDTGTKNGRGFGLISMRDRAESMGARLRVRSRRGRGTEVEFEL